MGALEKDSAGQGNNMREEDKVEEEWKDEDEEENEEGATKFIEQLPESELTTQEEELREVVLSYIDNWKSDVSSTVSEALQDPKVRRCKNALLPNGVSLKYWIEERIGGEIETKSSDGPTGRSVTYIGHTGQLELPVTKRRPDSGKKSEGKGSGKKSGKSRVSSAEAPWKKF